MNAIELRERHVITLNRAFYSTTRLYHHSMTWTYNSGILLILAKEIGIDKVTCTKSQSFFFFVYWQAGFNVHHRILVMPTGCRKSFAGQDQYAAASTVRW